MSSFPGSWMVDELGLPLLERHSEWADELQQMRDLIAPGHLMWISISGINGGKTEHFKHEYLAPLFRGFYLPVMELALRNTKEVIKLAGLDTKKANRTASADGYTTNPSYILPPQLITGVQGEQIKIKQGNDAELNTAVDTAVKKMPERTAGKGFPILFDNSVKRSRVVAAVQGVIGTTLVYTRRRETNEATEDEMKEWMEKWRRWEEQRVLITDECLSRG